MGKSIHGMRARSRDRARAHHNGRVSSRLFLAGCSPAEPASASPADATLRLHPPQCQRNFIERYFVTVLVVSAQGSTAQRCSISCLGVITAILAASLPFADEHTAFAVTAAPSSITLSNTWRSTGGR